MHHKIFVLDTNVILHDARCIDHFDEHDVVIPITVLEEIDKFKRGNEDIHFQARRFMRHLDELTDSVLDVEGVPRGEGLGNLRIVLTPHIDSHIESAFISDVPDHRILNTAYLLQQEHPQQKVVLVSKDINLRMKAKSVGLVAEDYEADKIRDFEGLYTGKRLIEGITTEEIEPFFDGIGLVEKDLVKSVEAPIANENFILRNGSKSALATYLSDERSYRRVNKVSAYGIQPRNAEQTFALRALLDPNLNLVTVTGKAGTGKTLLALAAALETKPKYRQIMLARPIVPLSNQDLGFLPGDIQAKLDPYMQPLFDNLNVIRHQFGRNEQNATRIEEMLEEEQLVITPLSYIRGRSLQKMFFIIDEAQNLTPHEVKTIITRAGEGTKIVLTGDLNQIDQPYLDSMSNGLSHLINRMTGQSIYAHVTLEKGERSPLADLASELL
ncbi:PhoH family protein [Mariniblastus fucicola]|uniref:PhoH-like protein n=1 Tax=Mariniblastus fucicola TaxID=980251 RepID=A0A5B9P6R3_9BACT|nr:PhoH family protein [Mariniblastus fucicola]QEG22297.1 PhoH-like protein [Mariniblastus fucicola]